MKDQEVVKEDVPILPKGIVTIDANISNEELVELRKMYSADLMDEVFELED